MKRDKSIAEKLLTEVELELMTILWRLSEGTVAEVLARLPEERNLAYTSVSTVLRILEQKGVVKARKQGRGHSYVPVLTKHEYEARAVQHVVQKVFDGAPLALVRQLVDSGGIGKAELEELRRILAAAGGGK